MSCTDTRAAQIILAGDHFQLNPRTHSAFAAKHGLGSSFLERICQLPIYDALSSCMSCLGVQRLRLTTALAFDSRLTTSLVRNYRAHPKLLALPSRLFYGDSLVAMRDESVCNAILAPFRSNCCFFSQDPVFSIGSEWSETSNCLAPMLVCGIKGRGKQQRSLSLEFALQRYDFKDIRSGESPSFYNPDEASYIAHIVSVGNACYAFSSFDSWCRI